MNKEKLKNLQKYLVELNNRLTSPIPTKHTHRPATFKAYLKREIEQVSKKIESSKMGG